MTEKPPLTPQEKKRLSLKKDRRNTWGDNAKAARRLIPRYKAEAARLVRRTDKSDLAIDPEKAEAALPMRLSRRWKKQSDKPLGVVLTLPWRIRNRPRPDPESPDGGQSPDL